MSFISEETNTRKIPDENAGKMSEETRQAFATETEQAIYKANQRNNSLFISHSTLLLLLVIIAFVLVIYAAVIGTISYSAIRHHSIPEESNTGTEAFKDLHPDDIFNCDKMSFCLSNITDNLCHTIDEFCELQTITTAKPTFPSVAPTNMPTTNPSVAPSTFPSDNPTVSPSNEPSIGPSTTPTNNPSVSPTENPSTFPSANPTLMPSVSPTNNPSKSPTNNPSVIPTKSPTMLPTKNPSTNPTNQPSISPTKSPSSIPTKSPTKSPTIEPTVEPTNVPTMEPTNVPTMEPTVEPTNVPTNNPSILPTENPSTFPSAIPTMEPTVLTSSTVLNIKSWQLPLSANAVDPDPIHIKTGWVISPTVPMSHCMYNIEFKGQVFILSKPIFTIATGYLHDSVNALTHDSITNVFGANSPITVTTYTSSDERLVFKLTLASDNWHGSDLTLNLIGGLSPYAVICMQTFEVVAIEHRSSVF